MLKDLKAWLTIPIRQLPFIRYDGAGDKLFGDEIERLCYMEGKITKVTNAAGNEVISMRKIYLDGNCSIHENDELIINGKSYPVQAVEPVFDVDGSVSVLVVYA